MRSRDAATKIAALADLATLTGSAAAGGGGVFPIDAKNNTVGLLDMGVAPDTLPGLQGLTEGAAAFGKAWGAAVPTAPGKDLWGIVEGIEQGSIKALYLLGCDLASLPDNGRIKKALAKLELLIVQDIFAGDSLPFAHVVLPAAAAAEKGGSFTSNDNRVQAIFKSVAAPGQAKADGEIIAELYSRLTASIQHGRPTDLMKEIAQISNSYAFEACSVVKGAAAAKPAAFAPIVRGAVSPQPRFQLLVGPIGFHNGTTSTSSENNLVVSPAGYLELHPSDAAALGVVEGASVKVSSVCGTAVAPAKISASLQPGLLFAPAHFRELNANALLKGSCNLIEVKVERG
jgi:formate dehydrogenase alpha subunit